MTDQDVRRHWDQLADNPAISDVEVTHRDVWQRWLEIETIRRFVRSTDSLLDVGCGSGYTTLRLAPHVHDVVGVDNSPGMIERAVRAASESGLAARFEVGDALSLSPGQLGTFDAVLSSRCLINLASWEDQQRAIERIHAMLKPGGRFLFVEGSADGRAGLNRARTAAGLDEMPRVWHNIDFEEARLLPFLEPMFTLADRRHFGVYDFLARIVHPRLVAPEAPQYDAPINRLGAELALDHQEFGDLSRVLFLVLTRKE